MEACVADQKSFLDGELDYRCKQCEEMTTAESFEQIVTRGKLCLKCINGEHKRTPKKVVRFQREIMIKSILGSVYECKHCGNESHHFAPSVCKVCDHTSFNRVK
jgi:rubrerythrin